MPELDGDDLVRLFDRIPDGYREVWFDGARWGLQGGTHARGRVRAVTARRLADGEVVGANLYLVASGPVLRPCEVPAEHVTTFLAGFTPVGPRDDASSPLRGYRPRSAVDRWRTRVRAWWWWQRQRRGRPPDA